MLHDISVEVPVLEGRYRRLLHLFRDNGVADIERFVQQTMADPRETHATLERAIEVMADLKQRENFEVYLKAFIQNLDIILPNAAANPYKIPTKRFGYILTKVKQRYKNDSLHLSGAGEKVKQLIDEHLISLGINPKIPPVELLSPKFLAEVEKNQTSKAKASEMEHAIRKYTHVHFDEDRAFYTKLSDKLEALIRRYKDDWEALHRSLFDLRQEVAAGRGNAIEGVSAKASPFYDLIGQLAFGSDGVPDAHAEAVKHLAAEVIALLQRTITIVNFWHNGPEVSKLKGALSDLILFTRIDALIACSDELVTEITALAKVRHRDIVS
jgi:type I restriction enzyme R subunit